MASNRVHLVIALEGADEVAAAVRRLVTLKEDEAPVTGKRWRKAMKRFTLAAERMRVRVEPVRGNA